MSKLFRSVLAIVLVISLFLTSNISAFAAVEEVYLSDLRIIYANDYNEAKEILSSTAFKDYKLLNENLNEDTKEIGVWLAYKTTTDIDDAITDLSVMQMNGGYQEGNYQEMLKESLEEYKKMGKEYEKVIEYFNEAYDAEHFLAQIAYRQLNLYTIKTIGVEKKPSFEGELLGDIFYEGIDSDELATIFMEGNTYVLDNVRSLLAMGVSYNEDGTTYFDKVGEMAAEMDGDPASYVDDEDEANSLAALIAPAITALKNMFEELEAYEDELNFDDEEVTDKELELVESKAMANLTRGVDYLDGKTFYEFCMDYTVDKNDYSSLYPLVAALNEGQKVMTKLACYYNVIRYSTSDYPEEYMESKVEELEEIYSEEPFNVYEGVDRTVFNGTFALTTNAYRADAYTDKNTLADAYFGSLGNSLITSISIGVGGTGIGFMVWGAFEKKAENAAALTVKNEAIAKGEALYNTKLSDAANSLANEVYKFGNTKDTYDQFVSNMMNKYFSDVDIADMSFSAKCDYLVTNKASFKMSDFESHRWGNMKLNIKDAQADVISQHDQIVNEQVKAAAEANSAQLATSTILFVAGGIMLLYSALMIGYTAHSYYHPDYEDIPLSMVDMRETQDGDRYIKYEVVREAEEKKDGTYAAGDLNAFEAQRWNALYYTKSYEAGKPLLADEFTVSTSNNKAKDGYTPVHRFGEEICYDLNKYNFSNKSPSIYLSVKQSKNDKSAVADVPDVVGSMFSNGLWLIAGSIGAIFGIGGTLATQTLLKKKKSNSAELDK